MKLHIKTWFVAVVSGRESRIGKMESIISIKLGEIELSRELTKLKGWQETSRILVLNCWKMI
jgi:hypothetical protein